MDAAAILADVQLALSLGKLAMDLGIEAKPYLVTAYDIAFKNKVLTAEERAAMRVQEISWRSDIDKAIAADDTAQ